jgi:hypothetical protein
MYRTTEEGARFLESYVALKELTSPTIDKSPFVPSRAFEVIPETDAPPFN